MICLWNIHVFCGMLKLHILFVHVVKNLKMTCIFFFKIRGLEQWESSLQQRTTTCHAAVTPAESKSNFVFQGIAN